MYIISKLFTYLLLPPGIFIIILFIASFLVSRYKQLFVLSSFVLFFISSDFGANMLLMPLENYEKRTNYNCKEVVVLSGGSNPGDYTIKTSPDAFKRLVYGIEIAKQKNIPLIFTGGEIETNDAQYDIKNLESLFNFKLKTYYENKSKNTIDNARFTKELIIKEKLSNHICLVTSAYHMKRSEIIFKHFGFNVIPMPVGFEVKESTKFIFLPKEGNFHKSYKAIHEYFGILSLYLRGF